MKALKYFVFIALVVIFFYIIISIYFNQLNKSWIHFPTDIITSKKEGNLIKEYDFLEIHDVHFWLTKTIQYNQFGIFAVFRTTHNVHHSRILRVDLVGDKLNYYQWIFFDNEYKRPGISNHKIINYPQQFVTVRLVPYHGLVDTINIEINWNHN